MPILGTSLRTVAAADSLRAAKAFAARVGVSRVTDTTRLDFIGVPVFASIRPDACEGSLCVNAGKGVTAIEAQVGAYMEAIEFAMAEPTRARSIEVVSCRDFVGHSNAFTALSDFCPISGRTGALADEIECVEAVDILTSRTVLVPAELVYLPFVPTNGQSIFGTSSNGLASGNDVDEATVHALLELLERDVTSFSYFHDGLKRVIEEELSPSTQALLASVREAGVHLFLSGLPNPFGVPVYRARIVDPRAIGSVVSSIGFGCHLSAEIAIARAVTEAAQSRLSAIHGGRDDLDQMVVRIQALDPSERAARSDTQVARMMAEPPSFSPRGSELHAPTAATVREALDAVSAILVRRGMDSILRIVLTESRDPVQVVRVIVPTLEYFEPQFRRIGPRLLSFLHGTAT